MKIIILFKVFVLKSEQRNQLRILQIIQGVLSRMLWSSSDISCDNLCDSNKIIFIWLVVLVLQINPFHLQFNSCAVDYPLLLFQVLRFTRVFCFNSICDSMNLFRLWWLHKIIVFMKCRWLLSCYIRYAILAVAVKEI